MGAQAAMTNIKGRLIAAKLIGFMSLHFSGSGFDVAATSWGAWSG